METEKTLVFKPGFSFKIQFWVLCPLLIVVFFSIAKSSFILYSTGQNTSSLTGVVLFSFLILMTLFYMLLVSLYVNYLLLTSQGFVASSIFQKKQENWRDIKSFSPFVISWGYGTAVKYIEYKHIYSDTERSGPNKILNLFNIQNEELSNLLDEWRERYS